MTLTLEELGERLREVPITKPDADLVVARVLRTQRTPIARRRPAVLVARLAAASLAILVALWGTFYFSPAAGAALAETPGVGPVSSYVLDAAGLGTGAAVTSQHSISAQSGVTVQLIGATASSVRTVVLIRITPADSLPIGGTLTDQFGTSYEVRRGHGDMRTGDWAVIFAPPSSVARPLGMRFTLSFDGFNGPNGIVPGSWSVSGIVLPHQGRTFEAPQLATAGPMTVTFSSGREADGILELTAHVQGVTSEQLGLSTKQLPGQEPPLTVTVVDPKGTRLKVQLEIRGESGGLVLDILAAGVSGAGTYTVRISVQGAGSVERSIVLT
jgi:hypothetical protein